ncbi:hypothetical protein [Nocardia sp. NPDC051463]|uniref:hypothetical protein n=1 Tax=Nocardia sp. NPDC051463 TaxID=3154845 RepID=UPI00344EBB87
MARTQHPDAVNPPSLLVKPMTLIRFRLPDIDVRIRDHEDCSRRGGVDIRDQPTPKFTIRASGLLIE